MPSLFEYLFKWGGWAGVGALGFGLAALVAAGIFMWRPRTHKLGFIVGMSLATVFMALGGIAQNVSVTMMAAARFANEKNPEWPILIIQGIAESLVPAVSGFTLLALAAFLVALGFRRMPG